MGEWGVERGDKSWDSTEAYTPLLILTCRVSQFMPRCMIRATIPTFCIGPADSRILFNQNPQKVGLVSINKISRDANDGFLVGWCVSGLVTKKVLVWLGSKRSMQSYHVYLEHSCYRHILWLVASGYFLGAKQTTFFSTVPTLEK